MPTFDVQGPFAVPVRRLPGGKFIDPELFWEQEDVAKHGGEIGCYVFANSLGRGVVPLYVGKTTKGFRTECFADHKIAQHYTKEMMKYRKWGPVVFLLPLKTSRGRTDRKAIDDLETYLIKTAAVKNPDLSNVRKRKEQRWVLNGVVRSRGRSSRPAQRFKRMLGIE